DEYELPLAIKDQVLIGANKALKKNGSEDPETARTNYFLVGHTCSDGSFLPPFLEAKVTKIKSNVEKNLKSKHYDVDDDPAEQANALKKRVGYVERDIVVSMGRAIFLRNQTNNPNEYDALVDLVIDENAEVSGSRGIFFHDIPVGEWFKYPSFLLKIIDED
ncbi:hypothetical protein GIB67_010825, partial [Kingdonia uniflora]